MGQVADAMISHGGEAVGVIPEFMLDYEIAHHQLTELHVVQTMHATQSLNGRTCKCLCRTTLVV